MVTISLVRSCGCTDTWDVPRLELGDPQVLVVDHACLPEICQDCADRGQACPTRLSGQGIENYPLDPITWAEEAPRRRYTRSKWK